MFYNSINWFRGVAIFFVVMSHVPMNTFSNISIGQEIFSNGSFFFVMISGFLFYHLKDRFDYNNYMIKKIKYVIIPYLFIATPSLLLAIYFHVNGVEWFNAHKVQDSTNLVYYVFSLITNGGAILEPLWFIPMITIYFIVSPIIKNIMESKFFGVFTIVMLTFNLLSYRDNLPTLNFIHWLGVYFFGAYTCFKFNFIKENRKVILTTAVIVYLCIHLTTELPSQLNADNFDKLILSMIVMSSLIIIEKTKIKLEYLDVLARYSFSIFFIHGYLVQVSKRLLLIYIEPSIALWLFTIILCIFGSIAIVKLWRLIFKGIPFLSNSRFFFGV